MDSERAERKREGVNIAVVCEQRLMKTEVMGESKRIYKYLRLNDLLGPLLAGAPMRKYCIEVPAALTGQSLADGLLLHYFNTGNTLATIEVLTICSISSLGLVDRLVRKHVDSSGALLMSRSRFVSILKNK